MSCIRYVLMIVIDPSCKKAIGLLNTKGPEFLIGKITFPGGKAEAGESPQAAASRELLEEAGVEIAIAKWRQAAFKGDGNYELFVMLAVSEKVHEARQAEEEPVFELNPAQHLSAARIEPSRYTPDFIEFLETSAVVFGREFKAA